MKNQAELIKRMTDKELLFHLYVTQFVILALAFLISLFLHDGTQSVLQKLNWRDGEAYLIGFGVGVTVVIFDLLFYYFLPDGYTNDGGINERIFINRHPLHILILAVMIGVSEEILFRGVIQELIGWVWTSLLFALIHVRYFTNWFLAVQVTLLSFLIGYVYIWTNNLIAPIILHITVDFLLGLYMRFKKKREKEGASPNDSTT